MDKFEKKDSMFDLENNGLIQKIHLKFNSNLTYFLEKIFNIKQCQIVICGFPRSGTSLLYNMISSSLSGFKFEKFEEYFIYRIHRIGNYATKAPMDVFNVKYIDKLNINKKKLIILILVRDVRDIITSRHPLLPNEYFIGYDHSWWPDQTNFSKWGYTAPGAIAVHKAIKSIINRTDVLLIKYEDLVADPNRIQSNIAKKYGLFFNGLFNDFHNYPDRHAYRYKGKYSPKASDLVLEDKRLSTERVKRWQSSKSEKKRVKLQFSECSELFTVLEDYGYEKSRDWYDSL